MLSAYKIRQPHMDALSEIRKGQGPLAEAAALATELEGTRALTPIRVVSNASCSESNCYEMLVQDNAAWERLGAAPKNLRDAAAQIRQELDDMEAQYGGPEPTKWPFGPDAPLKDVSEADEALRHHHDLKLQEAAFQGESAASRERSRSPRRG